MSRGLDLIMSMDENNNWIRTSKNSARRKTDYEKLLEKEIEKRDELIRKLIEPKSFLTKLKELFR